jgi:hypothetical protein
MWPPANLDNPYFSLPNNLFDNVIMQVTKSGFNVLLQLYTALNLVKNAFLTSMSADAETIQSGIADPAAASMATSETNTQALDGRGDTPNSDDESDDCKIK